MKNTTGQGDPERGDFGEAQSTFNGVDETLNSPAPIAAGTAQVRTPTPIKTSPDSCAPRRWPTRTTRCTRSSIARPPRSRCDRGYLDDQYNFLANTSYVTFPLQFIPRYGEAMKLAIEIAALQTLLLTRASPTR